MKKRIGCMVLAIVLAFLAASPSVYAAENQSDAAPLYIRSISCPSEYVDYASENVSRFINPLEITNPNNVSLGTPFSFAEADADVFYFPVFDSEKMKFLLRVYPDGEGYSAVLSAFLVDEIESLAPLTSPENPLNLLMADNTIIAMIGENSYTLFEYPVSMGCDSSTYSLSEEPDYHTIDAKQITQSVNMKQTRDLYTVINLNVTEHQTTESWCNAYCLATIIRTIYPNRYATASYLLWMVYNGEQTPDTPLPWDEVFNVAQKYGFSPVVTRTTVDRQILMNELNYSRPSIFWMKLAGNPVGGHAIVLRGYFLNAATWSIWNPWYVTGNEVPLYEQFPIDGTYLPMTKSAPANLYHVYGVAHSF